MNRSDSVTGLIWLLVGLGIIIWSSLTLRIGTSRSPGPGFLPLLSGILIAGLAVIVFFKARREKKVVAGESIWIRGPLVHIFVTVGILTIYVFVLDYLGFSLSTFLLMLFILTVVAKISWFVAIVESLIATGGCYLIFDYFMKVQLPKGWPGF